MNFNNMGDVLRSAGKIRRDIDRVQEDLKARVVEGTAGGGLVTVLVNGQQEVLKVSIDPKAVSSDPQGIEMLEDLILAALSQGIEKSRALKREALGKVTGGLGDGLSGLFA
jgi:hypothetical protein